MAKIVKTLYHRLPHLLLIITLIYTSLFFLNRQGFKNADLFRHLTNGRLVFQHSEILTTNFYSYTQPDHPFINHHWLSGVIFYQIQSRLGFPALTIFSAIIYISAILLALFTLPKSSIQTRLLSLLIALPVVVSRSLVRPEMFTYLGIALFIFLLERYRSTGKLKYLIVIPIYQLLWANLHIYYIFGLGLIGLYFISSLIQRQFHSARTLFKLNLISLSACLVNPFGYRLLLFPFTILQNYGLPVNENQSIVEYLTYIPYANYYHYIGLALLTIILLAQKQTLIFFKTRFVSFALLALGIVLGFHMNRNVTMLGLYWLAFGTHLIENVWSKAVIRRLIIIFILLIIPLSFKAPYDYYHLDWAHFGLDQEPGIDQTANFVLENNLPGPIFNNYNIGGYMIYYLYPELPVFVDNRPEAYPVDFFQKEYLPMQQNEIIWQLLDQKYNFQTIIYDYRDLGVWVPAFLERRSLDPAWTEVYRNERVVIFSKKLL